MKYKGYLYLAITIVIFSTLEVVSSTLKTVINPLQLTFIRFLIGGITLLPWALRGKVRLTAKDIAFLFLLGALNIFISMGSLQLSVSLGKASTAAILISSNPVFVALFSTLILKEKITGNKIFCILLGVFGIFLIIFRGNTGGDTLAGLLFGLFASLTFGLYTVLGKLKADNISSITMICLSSIFGSIIYIPVLIYKGLPLFYLPQGTILRVLYLGVFLSGIAYVTYMEALKLLTASKGSMVFFLKPVLATALAIIFLNESVRINTIIGSLLVLSGMFVNFASIQGRKAKSVSNRD